MVVGFVNAGLMTLAQAVGVVLGPILGRPLQVKGPLTCHNGHHVIAAGLVANMLTKIKK